MITKLFKPITWPTVLVGWCTSDVGEWASVRTLAGQVTISNQLLRDGGSIGVFRQWPSFDEVIMREMSRTYLDGLVL